MGMSGKRAEEQGKRESRKTARLSSRGQSGWNAPQHCCPGHGLPRTGEVTAAAFSMAQVTFGYAVKIIKLILGQMLKL